MPTKLDLIEVTTSLSSGANTIDLSAYVPVGTTGVAFYARNTGANARFLPGPTGVPFDTATLTGDYLANNKRGCYVAKLDGSRTFDVTCDITTTDITLYLTYAFGDEVYWRPTPLSIKSITQQAWETFDFTASFGINYHCYLGIGVTDTTFAQLGTKHSGYTGTVEEFWSVMGRVGGIAAVGRARDQGGGSMVYEADLTTWSSVAGEMFMAAGMKANGFSATHDAVTAPTDVTPSTANVWEDIVTLTGNEKAVVLLYRTGSASYTSAVRPKNVANGDSVYGAMSGQMIICGGDDSTNVVQAKLGSITGSKLFELGRLLDPAGGGASIAPLAQFHLNQQMRT